MAEKITVDNMFKKGVCASINHGFYRASYQLPKEKFKELPEEEQEIVRGTFDALLKEDKKLIEAIISYDNKTVNMIKCCTVSFPIRGVVFITENKVDWFNEYIKERTGEEREELINKAAKNYEKAIEAYKVKVPNLYELIKDKYPTVDGFKARFYFKFNFFQVSLPDDSMKFISNDVFKSEVKKMQDTVEVMKKDVCDIIYTELLEMVTRLKKQSVDGKPSQRTLNNLSKLFTTIDEVYSDFLDRDDIKKTIEKVKKSIDGVEAKELRDNDKFRKDFSKSMNTVLKDIKALPDVEAKRNVML